MISTKDIVMVSDLQDRLAPLLTRVRETGRPVVITQRGKPAGVLIDIDEYEHLVALVEQAELEEDFARGERAIASGNEASVGEVKQEVQRWMAKK